MRFLSAIAASVVALGVQSLEIVKEVEVDTFITALGKHIHLDHIFRHKNGVFTGDYYNNHRLNADTLKEERRTIWTDSFFTFMWLPQEVAVVQDSYAVYVSHQRNGSPPPFCAMLKYDLDTMYPEVGRVDTFEPSSSDTSTVGYVSLPVDHQRGLAHLLNGGRFITVNINETFSGFRVVEETDFRSSSTAHWSTLSKDGRYLYFTDDNDLKKMDTVTREVVDSLESPGESRKGSLAHLAVDPSSNYAYATTYRAYIREFPNTTYECFIIKYDLENFIVVDYEEYPECIGSNLYHGFGFVEPKGEYVYFGSSDPNRRVAHVDTIVKVRTNTLNVVDKLLTNYDLNSVVYDRNNQALAVGTKKGTQIDDQFALVINL